MINTAGAFMLLLISQTGAIATSNFESFDACKAAIVQIESIRSIKGFCIAKELIK